MSTLRTQRSNVRFWHKADITPLSSDVRYWGLSGDQSEAPQCPLLTQSGHGDPHHELMSDHSSSVLV